MRFNSEQELNTFREMLLNADYKEIIALWGTACLHDLLTWYIHIEYNQGAVDIITCLISHHKEQF